MNRRIRVRTYGGVRGAEGQLAFPSTRFEYHKKNIFPSKFLVKDFISDFKDDVRYDDFFCYLRIKKVVFFVKVNISKLVR